MPRLFLVPIGLFIAVGALCGCEDNPIEAVEPAAVDAGVVAVDMDAGMMMQAVPDSGVAGDKVRISITIGGAPAQGRPIIVQDADGAIHATGETDAMGIATLFALPNCMVTAAMPSTSNQIPGDVLMTWTDVQPGDDLVYTSGASSLASQATISVTMPDLPMDARYAAIDTGCGDAVRLQGTTGDVEVNSDCIQADGTVSILALVYGRRRALLGYAIETSVPISGGSGTAFLSDWQTDYQTVDIDISNPPVNSQSLRVSTTAVRGGVRWAAGSAFVSMMQVEAPDVLSAAVQVPRGFAESFEHEVSAYGGMPLGPGTAISAVRFEGAGNSGYELYDLRGRLPPFAKVGLADGADPRQPVLTWRIDGEPAGEDAMVLELTWEEGGVNKQWTFLVSPNRATDLTLPVLTGDLEDRGPSSRSLGFVTDALLVDVKSTDGYDAYRRSVGPRLPSGGEIQRYSRGYAEVF